MEGNKKIVLVWYTKNGKFVYEVPFSEFPEIIHGKLPNEAYIDFVDMPKPKNIKRTKKPKDLLEEIEEEMEDFYSNPDNFK